MLRTLHGSELGGAGAQEGVAIRASAATCPGVCLEQPGAPGAAPEAELQEP